MPAPKKEHARILPPEGSKHYPAYTVNFKDGRPPIYRYVIQRPGAVPKVVNKENLSELKIMRAKAERSMVEHSQLTFAKAIPLYLATEIAQSGKKANSIKTIEGRLLGFYEPVMTMPVGRLKAEGGYVLYMGRVSSKLGEDGKPVYLPEGYVQRKTKKRRGVTAAAEKDRSGRGTGLLSGRYQGIGDRFQRCQICGQVGHNRRAHRKAGDAQAEALPPPVPGGEFSPPSVATHQAALAEAKKFMAWLVREGYVIVGKDGKHPLEHVMPYGKKGDGGFGKSKLTPEELILLDRACMFVLSSLATFPEEVRMAWRQRAVAVLMALRCGARTGELLTARRRQFTILKKDDQVGGVLRVTRENAKTGTSERDLPIAPSLMVHVLPLLEGKPLEHFFLAGAPRGRTGHGIGGANWERDATVGFSKRWLANSLAKLCEVAGTRRANPHSLRGSYVDNRIRRGDPFADVSRDVGHGKQKTTQRHYTTDQVMAESEQRQMMERLGYGDSNGGN